MGVLYKLLRTWVDEFIPYYMEIMGVDRPWHILYTNYEGQESMMLEYLRYNFLLTVTKKHCPSAGILGCYSSLSEWDFNYSSQVVSHQRVSPHPISALTVNSAERMIALKVILSLKKYEGKKVPVIFRCEVVVFWRECFLN